MASESGSTILPGAASLMRRGVLDDALPFPPAQFAHLHGHWLALSALAFGEIGFVETPLYSYVQHRDASQRCALADPGEPWRARLSPAAAATRRGPVLAVHYYVHALRLVHTATVLKLRCAPRMSRRMRRELNVLLAADRSPQTSAALGRRALRELVVPTETAGAECSCSTAFGWRRLMELTAPEESPETRARLD